MEKGDSSDVTILFMPACTNESFWEDSIDCEVTQTWVPISFPHSLVKWLWHPLSLCEAQVLSTGIQEALHKTLPFLSSTNPCSHHFVKFSGLRKLLFGTDENWFKNPVSKTKWFSICTQSSKLAHHRVCHTNPGRFHSWSKGFMSETKEPVHKGCGSWLDSMKSTDPRNSWISQGVIIVWQISCLLGKTCLLFHISKLLYVLMKWRARQTQSCHFTLEDPTCLTTNGSQNSPQVSKYLLLEPQIHKGGEGKRRQYQKAEEYLLLTVK